MHIPSSLSWQYHLVLIYFTVFAVRLARDYTTSVSPLKETIKRTGNDLHNSSPNALQ